jgi:simple sugar transport system substrate-binding protein
MVKRRAAGSATVCALIAVLTVAAMLSGCAGPQEPARKSAVILGFSQLGSESGWRIGNSRDIMSAADRAGVQLMFENAEQKQENQIKAIRSFIAYQVDVIAFSPIVEDGWTNVLNEAKEAGIPVLCTDRFISGSDADLIVGFVGSDFYKEGQRAGEFLKKKADTMGKDHLRIVEITGTEDSTPMRQRAIGFRQAIEGDPRFEIVQSISGDFLKSKGKECMTRILKEQGHNIDVLYSHNDAMTLGAIEAIEADGLTPGKDIVIITVDGEQGAIDLLKQGKINCVVECTPKIGDIIMSLTKKLAAGENVERYTYSEETVFSEFDKNLQDIPPRGY